MRNIVIRITAMLMIVWYSMGIIGFDVHTCSGSGRSFVTTFIEGMTCEDIHPEHSCGSASCCPSEHEGCCSNTYQVLELTGTVISENHHHYDECSCGHCPCVGFSVDEFSVPASEEIYIAYVQESDSGFGKACNRQAAFSVWRI